MKLIRFFMLMLAISHTSIAFSSTDMAPTSKSIQVEKSERSSPSGFDISQLKTPTTPRDLLRLLRLISENFLMLDPSFQRNDLLLQLFDAKDIYDPFEKVPSLRSNENRNTVSGDNSLFKTYFKIDGVSMMFPKSDNKSPGRTQADFALRTKTEGNPFNAELVIHELGPNKKWRDRYGDINRFQTNEAKLSYIRHDLPTNPYGNFEAEYFHENEKYTSRLFVELNKNGTLRDVRIIQKDK